MSQHYTKVSEEEEGYYEDEGGYITDCSCGWTSYNDRWEDAVMAAKEHRRKP